jgi:hypothetical protein
MLEKYSIDNYHAVYTKEDVLKVYLVFIGVQAPNGV